MTTRTSLDICKSVRVYATYADCPLKVRMYAHTQRGGGAYNRHRFSAAIVHMKVDYSLDQMEGRFSRSSLTGR